MLIINVLILLPSNLPAILLGSDACPLFVSVDGMAFRSVRFPWIGFPRVSPARWCVPSPADAFLSMPRQPCDFFPTRPGEGEAKDDPRPPSPLGTTLAQSCADLFWGMC